MTDGLRMETEGDALGNHNMYKHDRIKYYLLKASRLIGAAGCYLSRLSEFRIK